jgi:trk system potassium uptake protein TrkA
MVPSADDPLEAGDELLFVANQEMEQELAHLLSQH